MTGARLKERAEELCPCEFCHGTGRVPKSKEYERKRAAWKQRAKEAQIPSHIVREGQAAQFLGKSRETLRDWRKTLSPDEAWPRYRRDGRGGVFYTLDDLIDYLIEGIKGGESR